MVSVRKNWLRTKGSLERCRRMDEVKKKICLTKNREKTHTRRNSKRVLLHSLITSDIFPLESKTFFLTVENAILNKINPRNGKK